MSRINSIWWLYFLGTISMIYYSWFVASEDGFRQKKKIVLKSNIQKTLLGFPAWINQIDRSYILINIFNELMIIFFVAGWFIFDVKQKKIFLEKLPEIEIIIILFEISWPIILGFLDSKEERDKLYIREPFDLIEIQGSVVVGEDNRYTYNYVFTHLKSGRTNNLVIFIPESYFLTQDMNGNSRLLNRKNEYETKDNFGTYQELSDCLVREGYATLRCERTLEELDKIGTDKANGEVNLVEVLARILEQEKYNGKIYLLSHGRSNLWLPCITDSITADGIISLCGAGMGVREEYIQLNIWKGLSRKKAEKKVHKIMSRNKELDKRAFTNYVKDEYVNMLISKKIPALIGYVKEDPYYDGKIAEEIGECNLEDVQVVKFEDTDFTFRKCRINKKRSTSMYGHRIEPGFQLPPMNHVVADEIIAWLRTH